MQKYFKLCGARKYKYLSYLRNIGKKPNAVPQANSTGWTSIFKAFKYHIEYLDSEKYFILLESHDNPNHDALNSLSATVTGSQFRKMKFELAFVSTRSKPFLKILVVFKGDLGQGCLLFDSIQTIQMEIDAQKIWVEESFAEFERLLNLDNSDAKRLQIVRQVF